MAAEDGNNGAWRGDTRAIVLLLLLLRFVNLPNKRLGGPGNTKVYGFRRLANFLDSQ